MAKKITPDLKVKQLLKEFQYPSEFPIDDIPDVERRLLESVMEEQKIKRKKLIIAEHETYDGIYVVKKGKVKLYKTNTDGRHQVFFICCPSDIFGHRATLSGTNSTVAGVTLEDSELYYIPAAKFLAVLELIPIFNKRLLILMSQSFNVLMSRSNILTTKTIKEKLALTLLLLNEKYREPESKELAAVINISRTDLASYIGTSIEVLVRSIKEFEKNKMIKLDGKKIIIIDFEKIIKATALSV